MCFISQKISMGTLETAVWEACENTEILEYWCAAVSVIPPLTSSVKKFAEITATTTTQTNRLSVKMI